MRSRGAIRRLVLSFVILTTLIFGVQTVEATVLDFEIFQAYGQTIPVNYGGFNWDSNLNSISEGTFYGGNTITFPSSIWGVFNGYGALTSTVSRNTPFDFNGAYFVPWLAQNQIYQYSSTTIEMKGYSGNTVIGDVTYNLTNTFDYYAANFMNVDKVEFIASLGGNSYNNDNERWWLMDNFKYNAAATVPEPTSMLLLGLGLMGLAGIRRKFKK